MVSYKKIKEVSQYIFIFYLVGISFLIFIFVKSI